MSLLDHDRTLTNQLQNPLLDTPIRHPIQNGTRKRYPVNHSKAAQFSTPLALRVGDHSIKTPGNPYEVHQLELKAEAATSPTDLRRIAQKLGKTAGRGLADSAINRSLYTGLREEGKKKKTVNDQHRLSQSTVLTQEASIILEEKHQARIHKKKVQQQRNAAKKEAKKMRMTINEYISWYNTEKAKAPLNILRTRINPDPTADPNQLQDIVYPESDREWQNPTPPPSPPPQVIQMAKLRRPSCLGPNSESTGNAIGSRPSNDLGVLFEDLRVSVVQTREKPAQTSISTPKTISIPAQTSSSTALSPEKRLPYIPIPLPASLSTPIPLPTRPSPKLNPPPPNPPNKGTVELGGLGGLGECAQEGRVTRSRARTRGLAKEVVVVDGDKVEASQKDGSLLVVLGVSGSKLREIWQEKRRSRRRKC